MEEMHHKITAHAIKTIQLKTMKHILFIIIIIIISCSNPKNEDIVHEFIKEFYSSEDYDMNIINNYMTNSYILEYQSLNPKEQKLHEQYIKDFIDVIRNKFKDNNLHYEIISSLKISNKSLDGKVLVYNGTGEIYYLLSKDQKIISFFIVKNNKIITFCPNIYNSKKGKIVPYFFAKEI